VLIVDLTLPENLRSLQADARSFARDWTQGLAIQEDSWVVGYSPEVTAALAQRGWIGMTWPREVGGGGRSELERFIVFETLIAQGVPIAGAWIADRQIGPMLIKYGTPAQQAKLIPEIISGRASWCIGMSEPDAGSDLSSIRTRADHVDGHYVISGQKIWTSGAMNADWCYLICRTEGAAPSHDGLSEFVLDMRLSGVDVRPIKDATGSEHFCEIYLDQVRIPDSAMVGSPDAAFRQTMRQLEFERGGIDRLVSNRALYEAALTRADMTDPRIRQTIGLLECRYAIGRDMVLRNVLGQAPAGYSAVTKIFCTELEQEVADFAATVFGSDTLTTARLSRAWLYAPAYTIQGGTTTVLRNVVAERVLGLPRR
jgi:alkylation response protein AidB-like acyl-CoA dehydrogenase